MTRRKRSALAAAALLALAGTAQALDLFGDIRKRIDEIRKAPLESIELPKGPAEDARRKAARVLGGFSLEEEVAIGRQAAGSLLGAAPLVPDPKLQEYVNLVGRWLASRSERPDLDWRFGVIDSGDINAFAAPGGFVFVTRGLYRLLRNESELAGVLAHEIVHVTERHHLKVMEQGRLVEQGGRVLSERAGANAEIRNLIGNGAELFARALDRNAEHEADRLAMQLAARAGYDPFGLPVVLDALSRIAKDHPRVRLLFSTHPHPDERLAALDATGIDLESAGGASLANRFYRSKR